MMSFAAVAGLVLALAGSAQADTVTWTGLGGDDKWSTIANWDADPTTGGSHALVLGTGTSILDSDTSAWTTIPTAIDISGSHTLTLATGGVLSQNSTNSEWSGGTIKFDGGTIGNPWTVFGGPRLGGATIEFHSGSFQAPRTAGEDVYIDKMSSGLIHVVGKTAGADFNPQYFRAANRDNVSFQFSMVAGEGVDKIALSSTGQAFRDDVGTAPFFALTVDGIQDYLDGGGTQLVWTLMTSAQAASDPTDDLTLIQAGSVDGGLGTVTATFDTVTLTITPIPEPSSFTVAALSLLGLVGFRRRRSRA